MDLILLGRGVPEKVCLPLYGPGAHQTFVETNQEMKVGRAWFWLWVQKRESWRRGREAQGVDLPRGSESGGGMGWGGGLEEVPPE